MIQPPLTPYKWQSSHPVTKRVVFTSLTSHCIGDNSHPSGKLTWLAGNSTICRCISNWKRWISIAGYVSLPEPIGSMGLVYLPTFTIKSIIHVGIYTSPMDPMVPGYPQFPNPRPQHGNSWHLEVLPLRRPAPHMGCRASPGRFF